MTEIRWVDLGTRMSGWLGHYLYTAEHVEKRNFSRSYFSGQVREPQSVLLLERPHHRCIRDGAVMEGLAVVMRCRQKISMLQSARSGPERRATRDVCACQCQT